MAAVAKMLGMVTVMFLPGGLIVLCAYFLGRAVHRTWSREREVWGETASFRRAVARVRFKDVLREARATF